MKPKSLQQRFVLFLLVPVAILLLSMGFVGFIYAKNSLLAQWKEAAILRLQRAAHDVDMRLHMLKQWLQMYHKTGGEHYSEHVHEWVLDQLRKLDGVERIELIREHEQPGGNMVDMHNRPDDERRAQKHMMSGRKSMMRFHRARIAEITPPRYDSLLEHETVSLISQLIDVTGRTIGELEVVVRFDYLVENLASAGWWQSNRAFLVDNTGKVLICNDPNRHYLGDNSDPLELATLKAMQEEPLGTVLGQGHPPKEVSGFYGLQEAPWTIVLVAPGREILAPIIRFRLYYLMTVAFSIFLTLLLIRWVTGRTVSSIKEVSSAAASIAQGDFGPSLAVKSQDEVGQLTFNFNTMVSQLQERMRLKRALDLAMEVQQGLLPTKSPEIEGFDVAGKSIYCDETGGDYYDFLEFSEPGAGSIGIAVGDVSGHGISAALLMTTVRALLRSRITQGGSLSQIVTDVNRLLCADTSESGNFMTMFFLIIDSVGGGLRWVRAGHDPAIMYDSAADSFVELGGNGIALGVDDTFEYQEYSLEQFIDSQIILVGTDGIWETENQQGEMLGKERIREIIRHHHHGSSQDILAAITDSIATFRQAATQQDDITLVVLRKVKEF
jgi:sigma-B regulation protein RsbU (phosphoserine phosphatase)